MQLVTLMTTQTTDFAIVRHAIDAGKKELEWQLEEASSDRMTALHGKCIAALEALDRLQEVKK